MDGRIHMCNTKVLQTPLTAAKIDRGCLGADQDGTSLETVVGDTEGAQWAKWLVGGMMMMMISNLRRTDNKTFWLVQLPGNERLDTETMDNCPSCMDGLKTRPKRGALGGWGAKKSAITPATVGQ